MDFGLTDAGHYAINSLRIEKGYLACGRELTPEYTPLEAGLVLAVKLALHITFRGREALIAQQARGLPRRMALLAAVDPQIILWGGELIVRNGRPAGHLTSAAFGHTVGGAVGTGYVVNDAGVLDDASVACGNYQIDVAGTQVEAPVPLQALYAPSSARIWA